MIAFTFPGQGSQQPGMGAPWTDHPSWELVGEAGALVGRDVGHLLLDAEADELTQTQHAQLATFVLSLVVLDATERLGVTPARLAGHSLGEYTALTASGALSFEDGVRLVAERGDAMRQAGEDNPGTMAAVLGLDDDQVEVACLGTDGDVWVANYNAPGQVVIAGEAGAVQRAGEVARHLGAKRTIPLAVSGAFHTPLMAPARDRLRKAVAAVELRDPEQPVVANVDGIAHGDAASWTDLLAAQLCQPVRWRPTLHHLADEGVTTFVELGPGSVLSALAKRTARGADVVSVSAPDDLERLVGLLAGGEGTRRVHQGEHVTLAERLVVSPGGGIFRPRAGLEGGATLHVGTLVGHVGEHEVRSPFAGTFMGLLADDGDRLQPSQPVAWLRTA